MERVETLESGFCSSRDRLTGRPYYAALWTSRDRLALYDRPLGHKGKLEDRRPNEGEIRVGYDVRERIFAGILPADYQPCELKPCEGLTYEGEPVDGLGGAMRYLGIVPLPQPSRLHCGGEVQAIIYLGGYALSGLPEVSAAYISRDRDGRLRLAIPA